jgi:kynureninase
VPDYRTPDRLRLGPAPLTTHFAEVYDALAVIRDVVSSGAHRGYPSEIARVT